MVFARLCINPEVGEFKMLNNTMVCVMFICVNCRKEKLESERCSVRWLTNIGFPFMAKMPWWPSGICKYCGKQAILLGLIGVVIIVVTVTIVALGK